MSFSASSTFSVVNLNCVLIPLLVIALFLLAEGTASAYVDPGTGSLVYQTALTILLGVGLVFRRVRGSIADFVRRLGGRNVSSDRTGTERD